MKTSNYFKSLFVITSLLLSFDLQAQVVSDAVNVQTAGTLSSLIPATDKYQITSLTVTGDLNGTDIRYIREMAGRDVKGNSTLGKLSVLDLSGANIVAGGSSYYNNYTTSLNKIGIYTFTGCTGLTSVIIPNNVISVENAAFYHCTGLISVTIPDGVTSIGSVAFYGCSGLTSITIPNSVTSIGDSAFSGCSGLTSITIPNSVTFIRDFAFSDCTKLASITIPNSVTYIGINAFNHCTKLEKIIVSENNTVYSSIEGVLFSKDCTKLIAYPYAKSNIYTLPNSVTSIGDFVFADCSDLVSITIPNSVTSIGFYTFWNCTGLTSITIPNSVTSIGNSAFYGCRGLTSITIPNSLTSIGISAFTGCTKLKEFIVSDNNPTFNSVEGVLVSKDCTKLIAYPNAKTNIYTLPNSVTSIGNYAFESCAGLASITIPNSVTSIGIAAFYSCTGLASITIPNSVTFIGNYAFDSCTGLSSITIPNSVTSIESNAFYGCTGITEIHCKILTPRNVDYSIFSGINKTTCKLYVPKGTCSNYLGATGWSDFTNIIEEEEATAISQTEKSNVKVYTDQGTITVTGADLRDNISVFTESGALLQTIKVTDSTIRITVPGNKIYFIKTAGKVFKVAL